MAPSKRKRANSRLSEASASRSKDFWFEDGNVVLEVELEQFRVHRGILASHSEFFKDLFGIPQPESQPGPLVDGCPVVPMSDLAEDWNNLLTMIYRPERIHAAYQNLPFDMIASILRLGDKYQFDAYRENALRRLKIEIPNEIHAWNRVFMGTRESNISLESHPGPWRLGNEFDLVNLAVELGIQSILPVAYYLCLISKSTKEIFDGYVRADGATARLSLQSQRDLVLGQERIRVATMKHTLAWLTDRMCPGPDDSEGDAERPFDYCQPARLMLLESMTLKLSQPSGIRYALDPFSINLPLGLCSACRSRAKVKHEHGRQVLWDELPSYFNLPSWNELIDSMQNDESPRKP